MVNGENRFVIGLTGSVGSGCTTLSKVLVECGFVRASLSDLIKEKFRGIHGKEPTRGAYGPNWRYELQNIGNQGRRGDFLNGGAAGTDPRGYWVRLALDRIPTEGPADIVVDGVRNVGEVKALREKFPQGRFWLVAVHADYTTRWKRVQRLGSYDNEDCFKRDDLRDSGEDDPAGQDVRHCVYDADYVFRNDDHLEPSEHRESVLQKKISDRLPLMKGQDSSLSPRMPEVFMATAVSQSFASRCVKRKVGAIIVDEENNIPLSVGYNDNPIGMRSCLFLHEGKCYKDMIMEAKLEQMAPLFCPECGTLHEKLSPPWKCNGQRKDGQPCTCNFRLKLFPSRNIELCTAIHAEERAIRSLGDRSARGCTLYVNTFPCFQCSRYIKDAGIRKIVYVEAYPIEEAKQFLRANGIDFVVYEGIMPRVFNQVFRQVR
jgi:deoxycytidylate deaminase